MKMEIKNCKDRFEKIKIWKGRIKRMKIAETLGAVYIYIYIVRFNQIYLSKHRDKTMLFRRI